ncbi:protein FAM174C [Lampris incognitus]|uniref:protein FAM174C n=1 Tax=Lampris incognitus TaxID=2546036 RepID=UPI0024B4D07A|nr:protein FAM174C [Lampris incognitus]
MERLRVLGAVFGTVLWGLSVSAAQETSKPAVSLRNVTGPSLSNSTGPRDQDQHGGLFTGLQVDGSMIQRALYVLIGITMVGLLYFLVRAVRLKKPSQRKKYGLLKNYEDSVEMEDLNSDEEETVYETRSLRR